MGHAIGKLQLLFGGKQRHLADLFKIHSDRIVNGNALRGKQCIDILRRFLAVLRIDIIVRYIELHLRYIACDIDPALFERIAQIDKIRCGNIGALGCFKHLRRRYAAFCFCFAELLLGKDAKLLIHPFPPVRFGISF